jgi:hypothetical protein
MQKYQKCIFWGFRCFLLFLVFFQKFIKTWVKNWVAIEGTKNTGRKQHIEVEERRRRTTVCHHSRPSQQ